MSTVKTILKSIYYDAAHPAGYGSAQDLYQAAKKRRKKIKRAQVEEFLQAQNTYTLHRAIRRRFKRRKTVSRKIDSIWQSDLIDLQVISKENRGFRYILVALDILSRYAFAVPIKDKTGKSIVNAFKKIFKREKRIPHKIQSDQGAEYFNKIFKTFLREKKIAHYFTASDVKAALIERFIRTLKTKLYRYFTARNTLYYLHVLPKLIYSYNHRIHSAHKKRPFEINSRNYKHVWQTLYGDYFREKKGKPHFKVGDFVRLSKFKKTFKKSYLKGWTDELFKVNKILGTNPLTYRIEDLSGEILKGSFYSAELSKVRV